jgi:hypothetical protein
MLGRVRELLFCMRYQREDSAMSCLPLLLGLACALLGAACGYVGDALLWLEAGLRMAALECVRDVEVLT